MYVSDGRSTFALFVLCSMSGLFTDPLSIPPAAHNYSRTQEYEEEEGEEAADEAAAGVADGNVVRITANQTLAALSDPIISYTVREIGHEAVWSLSTAKPGNGVEQIRDSSVETYWQSDGAQPHLINIQFSKRQTVCELAFFMDYALDESYTPKRMSIKVGNTFHDLEEVKCVELNEPQGWCSIPLYRLPGDDPLDDVDDEDLLDGPDADDGYNPAAGPLSGKRMPLRTHFVQISISSMHQNGRDTHCRMVKIFGPRTTGDVQADRRMMAAEAEAAPSSGLNTTRDDGNGDSAARQGWVSRTLPKFSTPSLDQFSTIR